MLILDRYIARQILGVTTLGVMALSALLLLGNLFKELRSLLLESGAPMSIVFEFILQVIPFSLMFSIPWGFLTAVLLVYGRLAADNELTSMRMAGMSLIRLSWPAIGIAVLLSGLCYWVNIEVSPRAKQAISDIIIKAASIDPKGLLREGQAITKFDNQEIYIDKREPGSDTIYGMHIYQEATPEEPAMKLHAKRVDVGFDEAERVLLFDLHDTFMERLEDDGARQATLVKRMPWRINVDNFSSRRTKANRFTNSEIREALAKPDYLDKRSRLEFMTEIPRRASFSMACIVFALIGVPLAINTRRKDTSTGFAMGIMIASLYFVALVLADLSRKSDSMLPYILLWLPNIIGLIVAFFLHKRARTQG